METRIDGDFDTRLLLLLVTKGILSGQQVASCQKTTEGFVEEYLCDNAWVTRTQLAEVMAESFGFKAAPEGFQPIKGLLLDELMLSARALPIQELDNSLVVAVDSPPSSSTLAELSSAYGGPIHLVITDRLTLKEKIEQIGTISDTKNEELTVLKGLETKTFDTPQKQSESPAISQPPKTKATTSTHSFPSAAKSEQTLIGGRYLKGERFLDGRFSILYKGVDTQNGLPVAIRHMESYFSSEDARAQTLREGRTLARLSQPNLPRIRHLVVQDEDIYLIADELAGKPLSEVIKEEGAFHPELVRRYLKQLLQVLGYLHSQPQPIIHRDLRPGSVLISPHGNLKIAEFGLAKMGEAAAGVAATSFRSAGDPNFAAPEQLLGDASSVKNDLYSIGAIAYYMAMGEPPASSLKRFSSGATLPALPLETDSTVVKVITECLQPKPEERCESAKELLLQLDTSEFRLPMALELSTSLSNFSALETGAGDVAALSPTTVDSTAPNEVPEAARVPSAAPPEQASKRSMWQLLFGKKKKVEPTDSGLGKSYQDQLMSFPFVDLGSIDLSRETCRTLPEAVSRTISGVCIGKLSDTQITIACKDPTDVYIYDQLALVGGGKYKPTLVRGEPIAIEHAQEYVYKSDHLSKDTGWSKFLEQKRLDGLALETTNEQAHIAFGDEVLEGPIVDAVDRLIKEAISADASDIHLEPFDTGMNIRYRIDGVLRIISHYKPSEASPIVKRIKVLANMDIAQERVTQGGRISLKIGSQEFDLRVSVVPVPAGESVVMRILKKGAFTLTLSDLGFSSETEGRYRKALSQPHGMILVCGPTGSGKSTTLYASLKEIARPDRKLLTAEDPIEYQMPGIIQVQMNTAPKEEEKRVTFSKALREFLRQDPDVILVGEIRDQETAEIGIQAALTGHLLLSTLHTNDSIGIISRLRDMGCEPFQIGSVLLAGLAQRLARRICQNCKKEVPISSEYLPLFLNHDIKNPKAYKGSGCRKCHQSGFKGRLAIYELLEISPEIRSMINKNATEEDIKVQATKQGFRDLLADGLHKVNEGQISLDEVLRVCMTV